MPMWGENIESRLLFLSQVGSRLTGHTLKLTQKNWTRQKNYSEFKNYIMSVSPIAYVNKKQEEFRQNWVADAKKWMEAYL